MAADTSNTPARLLAAFVGRERELAELCAGIAGAAGGRGCLFLIAGEPGIGKTRLAEEAALAAGRDSAALAAGRDSAALAAGRDSAALAAGRDSAALATGRDGAAIAAGAGGAAVVWGRCWEGGGAPPYWPWTQIFRRLAELFDPAALHDALADAAAAIAPLAPELAARAGHRAPPAAAATIDSEQERFLLFDAVSGTLRRLAQRRPLVVVLDDLHAADEPSLLLLEFVSRELRDSRLSLIGTYREIEAQRDEKRTAILHAAARNGHRLPLAGLARDEVERLVRSALGDGVGESHAHQLAERIYLSTDGNPFFVDEVLRLMLAAPAAAGGQVPLPRGVRDAVRERLAPLSATCRSLLAAAAVAGRAFDIALLESVAAGPGQRRDLLDIVGEAEAAGAVVRLPESIGRYAFAHALVRETLYEEIAPAERARLHWAVAEALARRAAASGDEPIAELAHHALRGIAAGDAGLAVEYATRAGHQAQAQLAYEEAAVCYRQAIDALALVADADLERRAEILLACGEAEAQAWNTSSAQETFDRAASVARELQRREPVAAASLLARAALGFGRTGLGVPRGGRTDPALVARLEEAIEALGNHWPTLRARALARLAVELYYSDAGERRAATAAEAAALAHRCDDVSTLAYVACAQHFAIWDSPDVAGRLALADEAVQAAQQAGEPDTEVVARLWRVLDVVESGDFDRWERELDGLESLARAMRQPRAICFSLTARAMRALWLSHFDEVEALGAQAVAVGERAQDTGALVNYGLQRFAVQRARGGHDVLLAEVDLWAQQLPGNPLIDCARALLYADLGQMDAVRRHWALVADDDFAPLRRVNGFGNVLCWLAETCVRLGDRQRAIILESELRPRVNTFLAFAPRIPFGPGAHWLGMLLALRGEWEEAIALLTRASELSRAGGGEAFAAWSEYELARILVARNGPSDTAPAHGLLGSAAATAHRLGLAYLGKLAADLAATLTQPAESAAVRAVAAAGGAATGGRVLQFPVKNGERLRAVADTGPSGGRYVLRREGEVWTASDGDAVVRLVDSKGLGYIAQLLREPEREFHVLDLVASEREHPTGTTSSSAGEAHLLDLGMHTTADADAGDRILDAQARTAYQRRLVDLRDDLEEATRFNDPGRAERARAEIEFIAGELARAVGIGGRDRSMSTGAERARVNVTRAVKAAIRRIGRGNANLGRYLETTIHTGTFCSYRPDPRMNVNWKLS